MKSGKCLLALILCLIIGSCFLYDVLLKEGSFVNFKIVSNHGLMPVVCSSPEGQRDMLPAHGTSHGQLSPGGFEFSSGSSNYDVIVEYVGNNEKCEEDVSKSSGHFSVLKMIHSDPVTNTISVVITTFDTLKRPKSYGGDVIVVWAEQELVGNGRKVNVQKRISGSTVDHKNGSYTGVVHIPWSGRTVVRAKIVATIGHTCRRFKAMTNYGNSVFATKTPNGLHYQFKNANGIELTRCSPVELIYGYKKVCNFTDFNFGLSWFCGMPTTHGLTCSDIYLYGMTPYDKSKIVPAQSENEVIRGAITEVLRQNVKINFDYNSTNSDTDNIECFRRSPLHSWTEKYPTGFVNDGRWMFTNCKNSIVFDAHNTLQCLKDKHIVILGDSTARQYLNGLDQMVDGKLHPIKTFFTLVSLSVERINITWRKHEMPFHNPGVTHDPFGVRSVATEIRNVATDQTISGQNLVLILNYNSHLQAFPVSVFRGRIKHLVNAIRYLLRRKPDARVLFKGVHLCFDSRKWFDARIALIYRDIVFEEFAQIRQSVTYLDLLSVSVAYNNEALHFEGAALMAQVSQLLTYICAP